MACDTIIQQGRIVATGNAITIPIRSDFNWIRVLNYTESAANNNNHGVEYYWQQGMPQGGGVVTYRSTAAAAQHLASNVLAANTGFFKIDSSQNILGAATAVTGITNATQPVVTTAIAGMADGMICRFYGSEQTNLNGLDFSIDTIVPATSFRLANAIATVPGVAGTTGFARFVAPDLATYKLFYPSNRTIANITAANPAVVTTLVDHGFITGQAVRIKVPAACGMIQMNDLVGTVTNINASTFSVNIDATAFTAFKFPLPEIVPFTPAEVIPVGETPNLVGIFGDATTNVGYTGVVMAGGVLAPGGSANDVLYWKAGKSFGF